MGTTKPLKPFIRKVLDINTEHITKEDNTVLTDSKFNNCPIACDPVEDGYYLYVGFFAQKPKELKSLENVFSPTFISIVKWAVSLGCDIIKIDGDGTLYEDLARFKW